ncbi:hypothetical protein [Nonomuraea endophytica]|uniref:hypothetical protein n=1 Tax=Nonomuraea endophytica TaxID=714136 RepID=UPI0037C9DA11
MTDQVPRSRLRDLSTRFVAVTPVNTEPTRRAEVTGVEDGLVTLALGLQLLSSA